MADNRPMHERLERERRPLVVERQGCDECMLATLAALARVPLAEVRAKALELAEDEWFRVVGNGSTFWWVVSGVAQYYDPALYQLVRTLAYTATPVGATPAKTLPPRGQGTVLVQARIGTRHIMPWQDGLLYDPGADDPAQGMALAEYLEQNPQIIHWIISVLEEGRAGC